MAKQKKRLTLVNGVSIQDNREVRRITRRLNSLLNRNTGPDARYDLVVKLKDDLVLLGEILNQYTSGKHWTKEVFDYLEATFEAFEFCTDLKDIPRDPLSLCYGWRNRYLMFYPSTLTGAIAYNQRLTVAKRNITYFLDSRGGRIKVTSGSDGKSVRFYALPDDLLPSFKEHALQSLRGSRK